ncbi:MAG: ABC transporter substrate-binding protein [Candidatus Rokuibacteriota bacterium]
MSPDRRVVVLSLLSALIPGVSRAAAQPAGAPPPASNVHRVAILVFPSQPPPPILAGVEALRQGLREGGWVEGRNVVIELRASEYERLDETAAGLVRERFDLIVAGGVPAARAAKNATATIPIVMASAADPVGSGVIDSLARPGGNVTGTTLATPAEMATKRLELLAELAPRVRRIAAVYRELTASEPVVIQWLRESETTARALNLSLLPLAVKEPFNWGDTLAAAKRDGAQGLTFMDSPVFVAQASSIAAATIRHRLPAVFSGRPLVAAGGLASYSGNQADLWRRVAAFVDRILRGAKPADLPVEQPTKFDLVINARTARTLGLTIPPTLRLRATEILA